MLNRLYRSKSFYLWSAVLLFLLIQTGHGRNRPSQDLLTSGRQALAAGNYNQAEDYLRRSIDRANAPEADTVLALTDLGNADAIEQVEAFIQWTNEPLRQSGPFDFGDPARIREGIEILGRICSKRYAKSDPKYLYMTRSSLGMTAMLLRLKARVDSRSIHDEEAAA